MTDTFCRPARLSRRAFLRRTAVPIAWAGAQSLQASSASGSNSPVVDTHMHVWAGDAEKYPFFHPYQPDFKPPPIAATVELLVDEMNRGGVDYCVLVQTIYHGWDNRYVAHCLQRYPDRFRGQGLIDPTDPGVAHKLEFWMTKHGLAGMRFSPIYYRGRDQWINARATDALWKKATDLRAIFNFFIATEQLPRLEEMIRKFPGVRVVIDHLARIDMKADDPAPEFDKLSRLARYPNVWAKVSELGTLSPSHKYPFRDTFPWVKRLYEAFGGDRLLWGTGFPGATRAQAGWPSLEQELALIAREIPCFSAEDRTKILGLNAAKLWSFGKTASNGL